jgi:glycosyltransferase involved in cell wall biosynthesis
MTQLLTPPPTTQLERRTAGEARPATGGKVLMVGAAPPPYHGSIVLFWSLMNSPLREQYQLVHLDISDHRDLENIGRFDPENVRLGVRHALACHRTLKQVRPNLVYVPIAMNPLAFLRDSLFLHLARAQKRPRVVHVHGGHFGEFYRTASAPLRAYIRWSLKGVAAAVVEADLLAPMFDGLVPPERVWTVPNGSEGMPEALRAQRRERHRPTVFYLGNLMESKGFLDVMAAAPLVAERVRGVRFVVAGAYFQPSDREKAEQLMQDPAIRAVVELPGRLTGDARYELMTETDLFVFPSYYPVEGQPTVLLEAMSAGLPIISTHHGAIPETVVDGETGYLVPKRSPAAIAQRVVELLENEPLRREMGAAGRRRYEERFGVESYGLGLAQVFDSVLHGDGRSRRLHPLSPHSHTPTVRNGGGMAEGRGESRVLSGAKL